METILKSFNEFLYSKENILKDGVTTNEIIKLYLEYLKYAKQEYDKINEDYIITHNLDKKICKLAEKIQIEDLKIKKEKHRIEVYQHYYSEESLVKAKSKIKKNKKKLKELREEYQAIIKEKNDDYTIYEVFLSSLHFNFLKELNRRDSLTLRKDNTGKSEIYVYNKKELEKEIILYDYNGTKPQIIKFSINIAPINYSETTIKLKDIVDFFDDVEFEEKSFNLRISGGYTSYSIRKINEKIKEEKNDIKYFIAHKNTKTDDLYLTETEYYKRLKTTNRTKENRNKPTKESDYNYNDNEFINNLLDDLIETKEKTNNQEFNYNYNNSRWNNNFLDSLFKSKDKITVSDLIDLYIESLKEIRKMYDKEILEECYKFENNLLNIINNVIEPIKTKNLILKDIEKISFNDIASNEEYLNHTSKILKSNQTISFKINLNNVINDYKAKNLTDIYKKLYENNSYLHNYIYNEYHSRFHIKKYNNYLYSKKFYEDIYHYLENKNENLNFTPNLLLHVDLSNNEITSTFINQNHKYKELNEIDTLDDEIKEYINDSIEKNKSIIINGYNNFLKITTQEKEQKIKEITKRYLKHIKMFNSITLDNGITLEFDFDDLEDVFNYNEFSKENLIIRVYDEEILNDEITDINHYKYKKLLDYKIKKDIAETLIYKLSLIEYKEKQEITKVDQYLIRKQEIMNKIFDQKRKEEIKRQEVLKLKRDIEDEKREIDNHLEIIKEKEEEYKNVTKEELNLYQKIKVNEEFLFENTNKNYKVIKKEFLDDLKYLDLSLIDFKDVLVRGIDFRQCNPILLDPQTVYDKDLSNTNFYDESMNGKNYPFGPTTNFKGVNIKGANLYTEQSIMLFFEGAITDENTILPRKEQELSTVEEYIIKMINDGNITKEEIYNLLKDKPKVKIKK